MTASPRTIFDADNTPIDLPQWKNRRDTQDHIKINVLLSAGPLSTQAMRLCSVSNTKAAKNNLSHHFKR